MKQTKDNRRILVIDDDAGVRKTYQRILDSGSEPDVVAMGNAIFDDDSLPADSWTGICFDVTLASDGQAGVQECENALADSRPFAVAFVDMKMPGMDGAQTSRKLWELDPRVKVVIVTAYSEYSPAEIITITGRDDLFYLRKPFNHEEIRQFARALSNEWNLEKKKDLLEKKLIQANQDLENKVQAQARLITRSQKMASMGVLAAGVAHEINNPASFINSNLTAAKKYITRLTGLVDRYEELARAVTQNQTPKARQLLKQIDAYKKEYRISLILDDFHTLADESIEGIQRISNIVRDLRNLTRMDESVYETADIHQILDDCLTLFKNRFSQAIQIEKQYGRLPDIACYPRKIHQVFMNLLINAGQAIDTGSGPDREKRIQVFTDVKTLGRRASDRFIEIRISDTGCGIPKEHLDKLFDPFFTTKPSGKGTGLGLSITYEIIKSHGGNMSVESIPGKGSTFVVCLPVQKKHRSDRHPAAGCGHNQGVIL